MNNPGFQEDNSLVTFSRLRYSWEKKQRISFSTVIASILFYTLMFGPMIYFLVVLFNQIRDYPLSSLELSTSLLLISHILFYLLLIVSHRRIPLIMVYAYESRRYLKARGIDSAYKARYYIIILSLLLFVFLPYFLVLPFPDSQFLSEQFKSVNFSLITPLLVTLFLFPLCSPIQNYLNTFQSFKTHMNSYFTPDKVEVNGKRNRRKFRMSYSLDEISSFVLLKIPITLDFEKEKIRPPPPEDIALLYLLDTLGNAHICSYYIQGSQLIQDVHSFLSKQYPDIKTEILIAEDSSDLESFFPLGETKNFTYLFGTSFVSPFFYPYMVIPRGIDPSKNLSDSPSFRFEQLSSDGSNSLTENLTFESLRSRYHTDLQIAQNYFLPAVPWMLVAILFSFILPISGYSYFGDEESVYFFLVLALLSIYIGPPRKWYLPGLQSAPSLLTIALIILILIA